jgi:hypothetical protein
MPHGRLGLVKGDILSLIFYLMDKNGKKMKKNKYIYI